jgi:hypothetical protein
MRHLGQSGSVRFAAAVNVLVATGALVYDLRRRRSKDDNSCRASEITEGNPRRLMPYFLALGCAGFSGFAALSYEII